MSAVFEVAYQRTSDHEGGYSNHGDDRGGETYCGISRRWYWSWYGWPIIDEMKDARGFPDILCEAHALPDLVRDFYRDEYWIRLKCSAMPQAIAGEVYDTAVNMGRSVAIKILQRSLNALNRGSVDYPDIAVDGHIGRKTIAAMDALLSEDGERYLLIALNVLQGEKYIKIMTEDPTQEAFARGWLNRISLTMED